MRNFNTANFEVRIPTEYQDAITGEVQQYKIKKHSANQKRKTAS